MVTDEILLYDFKYLIVLVSIIHAKFKLPMVSRWAKVVTL